MTTEVKKRKYKMKSYRYIQQVIRRLCSELFNEDMSEYEYISNVILVEDWIRCENALGRIDDECIYKAKDYARSVAYKLKNGNKGE